MGTYRHGVLIHNWNEDHFGVDACRQPPKVDHTKDSVAHVAHGWKSHLSEPTQRVVPDSVPAHLFFGHAKNNTNPYTDMQAREFPSCSKHHFKDPAERGPDPEQKGPSFLGRPEEVTQVGRGQLEQTFQERLASRRQESMYETTYAATMKQNTPTEEQHERIPAPAMTKAGLCSKGLDSNYLKIGLRK